MLKLGFPKSMDHENKSRASGQGVCLKRMSRTIQGFTLTTITATEKYTLVLDSTQLDVNFHKVDGP